MHISLRTKNLILLFCLMITSLSFSQETYSKSDLRGKFKIQIQPRKEAYSNREPSESKVVARDYLKTEVKLKWFGRLSIHETNSYTDLDLKYSGTWKYMDGKIILEYTRLEEKISAELVVLSKDLFKQVQGGKQYIRVTKN